MAAALRSSSSCIASLSASMRSSVVALSTGAAFEGPWSAALVFVRRFCSLGRGAPPSFAWTVRSWRRRRSRRTNVDLHFKHLMRSQYISRHLARTRASAYLKGLSLVSVVRGKLAIFFLLSSPQRASTSRMSRINKHPPRPKQAHLDREYRE